MTMAAVAFMPLILASSSSVSVHRRLATDLRPTVPSDRTVSCSLARAAVGIGEGRRCDTMQASANTAAEHNRVRLVIIMFSSRKWGMRPGRGRQADLR